MSFLIAAVLMIALCAVLTLFMGKKDSKKGKGVKNKAQIVREANRRLAKNPHDPLGLVPLGEIYFESQLWDKAYNVYSDLVKIALAKNDGSIDLFSSLLRQGITALHLEKLPEATQSLMSAIKINSVAFEPNYYLGKTMSLLEQYDKAIPLFKKALLAKPEATDIYIQLGQCFYKAKKYRDSLPCFKRALDEDPGNKEALFHMADAMSYEGHPEKAIKVFMHLRADPTYGPRSCLQAGIFHLKTNEAMSAIQDLEIGLKHENIPPEIKIELEYNLARSYFEANMIPKGLGMLKTIRTKNANYKDVNTLISRYQELSQNSNLQIYISANSGEFATLCRKFISTKYRNSTVRIQSIDVDVLYTDILAEIFSSKWEDVALFRFFRTTGATGEIYVREFHGHMSDVKAASGFCISAGTFTEEARKYIEGRPIDLIEKNDLTKILKQISF